jgi:DNA modification methylase
LSHKTHIEEAFDKKPGNILLKSQSIISPLSWYGSCLGTESTLHQIAPYIGKMKSTMARAIIEAYSRPRERILDPFVGSGVIALESIIDGREIVCSDINPYAVALTKAKLFAPPTLSQALTLAERYLDSADNEIVDMDDIPDWVKNFFDARTLKETITLATVLRRHRQHFLLGCLLGILHHQRPGFLSYPASHAIPYLRNSKFPRAKYPELYEYRAVKPRFMNKICRVYRRFPNLDHSLPTKCYLKDVADLNLPEEFVDTIITSPPYVNALDYIRDNRLRLWFLGYTDENALQRCVPKNTDEFEKLMYNFLKMVQKVLRHGKPCIIVLGEVNKPSCFIETHKILLNMAEKVGGFECEKIVEDYIPKDRRVRKEALCTKKEWIVVLKKG